jgi:hypothetical protein
MQCRLPVSGLEVSLCLPRGREDVFLCEWSGQDTALTHELLNAITQISADRDKIAWGNLPITDIEWVLLLLRRALFGDFVRTGTLCSQPECGAKVDVSFRISEYVAHFQISVPAGVEKTSEPGWYSFPGNEIKFRLPTGYDQMAVSQSLHPDLELQKRCVAPDNLMEEQIQKIQEVIECMAPTLSGPLEGQCPECGSASYYYFDVQTYVLRELLDQAEYVFEDVHLLAGRYQWSEDAILNLPRQRRYRYVEAILRDRRAA